MKNFLVVFIIMSVIFSCTDFDIKDQGFDLEALPESVSFNGDGDNFNLTETGIEGNTDITGTTTTTSDDGITLQVEAPNGTDAPITVSYSLGGTATFGTDYVIPEATATGGTVTIDLDPSDVDDFDNGDIDIQFLNDNLIEGTETIIVTLISATRDGEDIPVGRGGTDFGREATVNITDVALSLKLSSSSLNTVESAVSDTLIFFAELNFPASSNVTYDLSIVGSPTIQQLTDFVYVPSSATPGSLTINAGELRDTIQLVLVDDNIVSSSTSGIDSILFEISNASIPSGNILVGDSTKADVAAKDGIGIFVRDDFPRYGFSVSADTITLDKTATYSYTVTLIDTVTNSATPAFSDIVIPYTTNQGTATIGADFNDLTGGSITIPQGQSTADISIQVLSVGKTTNPIVTVILDEPTTTYAEVLGITALDTLQLEIE